jgi:hypothetical protein
LSQSGCEEVEVVLVRRVHQDGGGDELLQAAARKALCVLVQVNF